MFRRTQVIAHRGGAGLWPENSRAAITGARGLAVDGIEVDVHLSADDEVMIVHDATLDRTTRARGRVREKLASELARVDAPGSAGGLPRLADLLDVWGAGSGVLSIELKNDVDDARYPGLARAVVDALDARGLRGRAFVHAFDWGYLDEVRAAAPDVALGGNVERADLARRGGLYAILDALAARRVEHVNIDHRLMDAELVAAAQERGLKVTLWTVNDPYEMERFLKAGADVLCTDRPDVALAVRDGFLRDIGLAR